MGIRRWLRDQRGTFDEMLMSMQMILILLAFFFLLATVAWIFEARNTIVNGLVTAANQALVDASLNPALATSGTQAQAMYVNQPEAVQAFTNLVPTTLSGWSSSAYTMGTPLVYEPSQKGQALPNNMGAVPGAGMYVAAEFHIRLVPWTSSAIAYHLAVQLFVPANRYDNYDAKVHGTWIGG